METSGSKMEKNNDNSFMQIVQIMIDRDCSNLVDEAEKFNLY